MVPKARKLLPVPLATTGLGMGYIFWVFFFEIFIETQFWGFGLRENLNWELLFCIRKRGRGGSE